MHRVGLVEESTVEELAEQARRLSGTTEPLSPKEALALLKDVGREPETYILVTEDGREIPAVMVEDVTVFNATANDIRKGTVAATASGVTEGTKVIPSYHTTTGWVLIPAGRNFEIKIAEADRYDFTKLQAILCPYNGTIARSVSAEKVVIEKSVYDAFSTEALADITVDHEAKKINFGIENGGDTPFIIRYFTYKEEY